MTKAVEQRVAFFMRPNMGRIIVKEDEFSYQGRIVIPDTTKRRPTTGIIVAIAEGLMNGDFKVGGKVVYGLYSGTVINFKGQPAFRILGQEEVLAFIDDTNLQLEGVGT